MSKRRVLIIAYYFPPSGGSGVQRALKFVKYLPQFDWQPVVLTLDPESAAYPNLDPAMLDDIPAEAEVHRTGSWDPYRLYAGLTSKKKEAAVSVGFLSDSPVTTREKFSRWVRANVFIPDARVGWYFYALKRAKALIEKGNIDAIFTTGPPHSTHLIGRALKRKYDLPWIADFRDPWVDIDFLEELPMSDMAKRLNASLEQSVLDESSLVLTVSPAMHRAFDAKTNTTCQTIYNGFDDADFTQPSEVSADIFYVSHVGNMNAARNPKPLWHVLAKALKEGRFQKLRIKLVGNVDGSVMEEVVSLGVDHMIDRIEYCPHDVAVRHMRESHVLLLPINNVFSAKGIVTGKLFEYMAAKRPVLGIGPPDGDAAALLDETGAGRMIDYEDEDGVSLYLNELYDAWERKVDSSASDPSVVEKYSRRGQTAHLAKALDNLVAKNSL